MQKYHDEPKQYKGYLKSALERAVAARPPRVRGPQRGWESDPADQVGLPRSGKIRR